MAKHYHKYKDALQKRGYTVDDEGFVRDAYGNAAAGEDRFGNVYCNDPNITAIIIEVEESGVLAKLAKTTKKAVEKAKPKLKKVRARNADGTLRGDDPNTPDVNEAWTYIEDK
jgi:hypothetical protein